jgi:site-specific recombinase XerD
MLARLQQSDLPGTEYAQQYLRYLYRRDLSMHTIRSAFSAIQFFLAFMRRAGKTHLATITKEDLEAFIEYEQDRGARPLSVKTRLQQLNTFVRFLIDQAVVNPDVVARPIRIKLPEALPRAMDPDDVQRLLSVINDTRDRAMVLVLLRTGMRIGELLRTRLSELKLTERKVLLFTGEKNRVGRVVYFSDDAYHALGAWLRERDSWKRLLFYARGRNSMSYTAARMIFAKYLDRAGLSHKGYSLHCLRHSFATELLNAGMRLECLQQLLGHSTLEQTRRYARLTDKTREEEYFRAMAIIEGRHSDDRDRLSGTVSALFEATQLFSSYDQELHEHAGTFSALPPGTD